MGMLISPIFTDWTVTAEIIEKNEPGLIQPVGGLVRDSQATYSNP